MLTCVLLPGPGSLIYFTTSSIPSFPYVRYSFYTKNDNIVVNVCLLNLIFYVLLIVKVYDLPLSLLQGYPRWFYWRCVCNKVSRQFPYRNTLNTMNMFSSYRKCSTILTLRNIYLTYKFSLIFKCPRIMNNGIKDFMPTKL